jgi:hypothetical protein
MSLDCTKCGGPLEVTEDIEMFKCPFCGTPFLVERSAGSVTIRELTERVDSLEVGQREVRLGLAAVEELKQIPQQRTRLEQEGRRLAAGIGRVKGVAFFLGLLVAVAVGMGLAGFGVWFFEKGGGDDSTAQPFIILIVSLILTIAAWVVTSRLVSRIGTRNRLRQKADNEAKLRALAEREAELKRRAKRARTVDSE